MTPWGRLATRKTNTLGRQKAKPHLKSDLENVHDERWHGKMTSPWCGQAKRSNTELSTFLRGWGTKHCSRRNIIQEVNIPKNKLYQNSKVDVRCFSEVEEGNAEQFWCSSSSPGRHPTYSPPCTYSPHTTFFTHFPVTFTVTFSWPLAHAWCIDPQCAPSHTQLRVWQSSFYTPM